MNILLISWNFPPKTGGIESIIDNIWKRLNLTNEIFALVPYTKQRVNFGDNNIFRPRIPGLLFYFMYAIVKGVMLIRRKDIDIIFSGSALTCPIAVLLARRFNIRLVINVYGLDLIYSNRIYQFLLHRLLPKSDGIVAISHATKLEAVKRGVSNDKVRIIYPGINLKLFEINKDQDRLKEKYGFKGRKVILTVGRLARRKGIAEFIENALPQIVQAIPEAIYLIVGGNPIDSGVHKEDSMSNISEAVELKRLQGNVSIFGFSDSETLIELYNLCDIFLLPVIPVPGDIEGFGIVLIEASAAGKAVVSTRIGGIPDAIEDGKSGIIVEPNNYALLSREIIALLKDPERRSKMGNYGKERVREKFDWELIIKDYINLFNEVLQNQTPCKGCQ